MGLLATLQFLYDGNSQEFFPSTWVVCHGCGGENFVNWNSYNPTELKSYLLKISRLILQILVMSLSSFICRNLKRRSFTMSYFERNMSIMIKYCSCINFYVCLGYCKLCFGSVSSSVFFQLILLVLEWEGGRWNESSPWSSFSQRPALSVVPRVLVLLLVSKI